MASSVINELLKPSRLDVHPNSTEATKQFKHWLKIFTGFVEKCSAFSQQKEGKGSSSMQLDKFQVLCAYVSADVYVLIEDCDSYDAAIQKLKSIYIKSPNIIFARHLLATRKQKSGESIPEFLRALHALSKDCNFTSVTAEVYCSELVRDAFINGLASQQIRQRLLENNQLTLDRAFEIAKSLQMAQEYSATYAAERGLVAAIPPSQQATNESYSSLPVQEISGATTTAPKVSRKCYFCGRMYHRRDQCPAKNAMCYLCGKSGHFSRVCQSKSKTNSGGSSHSAALPSPTSCSPSLCSTFAASCPGSLLQASLPISVNGKKLTALIDSGSSESYVNSKVCKTLKLEIYPSERQVQMASSTTKIKSCGFCVVNLKLIDVSYESVRLNVFDNLCSDVILGLDFQTQHQRVVFEFNGDSPDLVVSPDRSCALTVASTEEASLFSNLSPNVTPIATKSRRFNDEDRKFIQKTVDDWLAQNIIEPSSSPWRAQVVVVKNDLNCHRKRLCIDYSQTINLFTELDAYPLPQIDDMINKLDKYTYFSTFDLRSDHATKM